MLAEAIFAERLNDIKGAKMKLKKILSKNELNVFALRRLSSIYYKEKNYKESFILNKWFI